MEIREITDYHLNMIKEVLEVSFRTLEDEEDVLRSDKIGFFELESFGFGSLTSEIIDEDSEDDIDLYGFDDGYNEDEIISFLNEYYLIFPDRLPKSELL